MKIGFPILLIILFKIAIATDIKNSATLTIKSGSVIVIKGNYTNSTQGSSNGAIINDGTIRITGNWNNNATAPGNVIFSNLNSNGLVEFIGTSMQTISGDRSTYFENLSMNNSSNITLGYNMTIYGTLNLTNGILKTGSNTITLTENASISPEEGSATSFIDGTLQKTGNGDAFIFPVGDIQGSDIIWAPVQIEAWDNSSNFSVHYTYKSPYDSLEIPTWNTGNNLSSGIHHVSGKEFWNIERTGASQNPKITLFWKNAVNSGIANSGCEYTAGALENITFVHWNGSLWENMGGTAESLSWPTGQIQNSVDFTSYSPITIGSKTALNPLPVELLQFKAKCLNNEIELSWITSSETNNNYFLIEKTCDFINWELVNVTNGAGNSNTILNYKTHDKYDDNCEYYYRIANVDFNGVVNYKNVIQSHCSENESEFFYLYPNPASEFLNCSFWNTDKDLASVYLNNALGEQLYSCTFQTNSGLNNFSINLNDFAAGVYLFQLKTNFNKVYIKKIIINK